MKCVDIGVSWCGRLAEMASVRVVRLDIHYPPTGGETGERTETYVFCINLSGLMTPEEKMAPADLAVP